MKKPKGKIGCAIYVIGFFLIAALFYGLVIEPLTPSTRKVTDRLVQQLPTDEPTVMPTVVLAETHVPDTKAPTEAPTQAPTNTPAPTEPPTLRQSDKGEAVRQIQSELIRLGYLTGNADGDFGKKTTQAIKDFQVCNGLNEDGIWGKACWNKINGYYIKAQITVYVSKSGIYHTIPDCSGMKSSTKMSLSDAIRKGYKEHSAGCH